jgi:hypothetical protein
MKQFAHRIPDVEFSVPKRLDTAADKIYLGLFLALCLFFAMLSGNLLFIVIAVILSVFIMLSYSTSGTHNRCLLSKEGIVFDKDFYPWERIKSFNFCENSLDNNRQYIRLAFIDYLNPYTYIPLPGGVQNKTIYDILSAHLEENPNQELSIAEMLMMRFFKW